MIISTDDYKVKESNTIANGNNGSFFGGNTVLNISSDKHDVFSFSLGVALSKKYHRENAWDFTPKVNAGVIFTTSKLYATVISKYP